MKDQKEHWVELCEQAAVEQDPETLLKLVNEISRELDGKEQRLEPHSGRENANLAGGENLSKAG
jgi:hypothetical protein